MLHFFPRLVYYTVTKESASKFRPVPAALVVANPHSLLLKQVQSLRQYRALVFVSWGRRWSVSQWIYKVLVNFLIVLSQAKIIWEEGVSIKENVSSSLPMDKSMRDFRD